MEDSKAVIGKKDRIDSIRAGKVILRLCFCRRLGSYCSNTLAVGMVM